MRSGDVAARVAAFDNPNGVVEPDNSRIGFISFSMACQSLRKVYPGLGSFSLVRLLNLGFVRLGYICRGFQCHQSSKRKGPRRGLPKPISSDCVKCFEGNPMLHLYSTALLAVLAANALVVLLAIVGAVNSRKHDRWSFFARPRRH